MTPTVSEAVRLEREVIILALSRFMQNARELGHYDEALAFEAVRNWVIRRQSENAVEP